MVEAAGFVLFYFQISQDKWQLGGTIGPSSVTTHHRYLYKILGQAIYQLVVKTCYSKQM